MKKAIVKANKEALESVGIDQDISGKEVFIAKRYGSGWLQIRLVELSEFEENIKKILGTVRKSTFDIPPHYVELIK